MDDLERIAAHIVDAAVKLHMRTGPGLLETVYATLLGNDLVRRGLKVERQKRVPLELEGVQFRKALRVDLLVDGCVVVNRYDGFGPSTLRVK